LSLSMIIPDSQKACFSVENSGVSGPVTARTGPYAATNHPPVTEVLRAPLCKQACIDADHGEAVGARLG